MAIEYKAFAAGKEVDSFYSGGKEIQEIWGGDTLLWKKGSSSVSFDLTVTEGLDYFVPPSSFFTAIKQIFLNPLLLDVPLNRDNIEFGFYGEDEITTSGNTRRVSSYAYLLCKAKTEELKKNIDKVFFYTCDVDGKGADLPNIWGAPDKYKKVGSKIILSDNVFSLDTYYTGSIGKNGIQFFNNKNFNPSTMYNPGIVAAISGTNAPILHQFKTKAELMTWAVS